MLQYCEVSPDVLNYSSSASYKDTYFFSFPLVRVISYEEGKALAESWNAAFLESSAKENQVRDLRSTVSEEQCNSMTRGFTS